MFLLVFFITAITLCALSYRLQLPIYKLRGWRATKLNLPIKRQAFGTKDTFAKEITPSFFYLVLFLRFFFMMKKENYKSRGTFISSTLTAISSLRLSASTRSSLVTSHDFVLFLFYTYCFITVSWLNGFLDEFGFDYFLLSFYAN